MAEVKSQSELGTSRQIKSTVVFRATTPSLQVTTKDEFWSRLQQIRNPPLATPSSIKPDQLKSAIRQSFPQELQKRFVSSLRQSHPLGTSDPATEAKRQRALSAVRFYVEDISYGSIDIKTIIEHLDQILDAFSLSAAIVTIILSANAPGALNDAIGNAGIAWDVTVPVADIQAPAPQQPSQPTGNWLTRILRTVANPVFLWQVLNALWILPIAVSLFVLFFAYREFDRITEARDDVRSKVITSEIERANLLYDRFDQKHELILKSQASILKETADAIRVVLADEIKRAADRSTYFDQQHVALLQRYENISKESSSIINALIQKSDNCCCASEPKKPPPKDRCQKPPESK